jgi:spore coat protein U-like protein
MGMNGVAALAALGILCASLSSAHAGEARAALAVNAYVSVTGSIDVRAAAQEPTHTANAANASKIGSCASVPSLQSFECALLSNAYTKQKRDPKTMTQHIHRARIARMGVASLAVALFAGAFAVSSAQAGTVTATMAVSASIAGTCTVSGSTMSFGSYSSAAPSTASSSIQVTCSNGTSASVTLNQGNNNNKASTFGTRALNNGTNYLGYDIYTDNTYAKVWNTAEPQTITSTGSPVTLTAYGRVPAGQNPVIGSYNDTVTISVSL